jgi:predicted ATPase
VAGQLDDASAVLRDALDHVHRTNTRYFEAELHRLMGECWVRRATATSGRKVGEAESEAETHFRQALAVARRQQAKSLELRAVVSLTRLLQGQRPKDEARQLLSETYGWFTEGFDTPDLREAKSLLDALP